MANKNNHAKLLAAVGAVCLVAGILEGMLIIKAFFMPETVIVEVPTGGATEKLNPPKESEPIVATSTPL